MKIDRRAFLAFGIGGAVGTALSPLPWKLTDDLSIWTQMWPWTPVPKDGEYRFVHSVCTLCPGGCGISVRMVDDRAVKIEGRDGFPINDGGICILGLSGLQTLYGPHRVRTPLRRVGARGAGRWEKISWDAALQLMIDQLKPLQEEGETYGLGCISGRAEGTVPALFRQFLGVFGSPNFFNMPSIEDAYELTLRRMNAAAGTVGFDLAAADCVLSFGAALLDGWGSPVRVFRANSTWKEQGTRLVQIEPRLSNTAAKADQWVPITPGSEAVLALGIAQQLVASGRYDKNFVERFTRGFDAFKAELLAKYPPARVEEVTGVPAATVTALADAFGNAQRPLALAGRGGGSVPGAMAEFTAIHALNVLAGAFGPEGSLVMVPKPDYIDWDQAIAALEKPRLDRAGSEPYADAVSLLNRLPGVLNGAEGQPLKVLFIHDANPLHSLPDGASVRAAFEKVPFIVSFSSYMDETAAVSDLILPDHNYLEAYRDVPTPPGYPRPFIGLAQPVVAPQCDTRYSGDVLIAAAQSLGEEMAAAFQWENYENCLQQTLEKQWDELEENGFWEMQDYAAPQWRRFFPGGAEDVDFGPVRQAAAQPVTPEGDAAAYPLQLIPYDSIRITSGYIGDPPFMIKTVDDTILKGRELFVEINPETAAAYGLKEGERVHLKTPRGEAPVRVHLYDGIKPGVVAMPRGLGHSAYDKFLAGKGVNVNDLIGPVEDPASGLEAAWGIRAQLA